MARVRTTENELARQLLISQKYLPLEQFHTICFPQFQYQAIPYSPDWITDPFTRQLKGQRIITGHAI